MIPLFNFMIAEGDKKDKQRTDPAIHKTEKAKKKGPGNELCSQGQAQLSSPRKCLTSEFGMSSGGSTSLSSPDLFFEGSLPQN